jgi:ABC-2 type transport system ATP-binding protein
MSVAVEPTLGRASIRARDAGVRFLFDSQQRVVTPTLARLRRRGAGVWGLRHVDLALGPGDGVALLGKSGSGKTTLLRLMAGVLVTDEGELTTAGQVASLLSIHAGVLGALTGRENTHLLGTLAGLDPAEARAEADTVKDRSRLGDAFERPVSSYSQGMRARLGFSAVTLVEPQIMLLDEVHEAFDHEFRDIVHRRAEELRRGGGIVVAAGHDHGLLSTFCDTAIHMARGEIRAIGPFERVRTAYIEAEGHDTGPERQGVLRPG